MNGRLIGVVYLGGFVVALVAEFFAQQAGISLLSSSSADAATTSHQLLTHQEAFRAGFALAVLGQALYIALTALFYRLFKPVSATVALVATFFGLVANAVQLAAMVFLLTPLALLGSSAYHVFTQSQLQALTLLSLKFGSQASAVYLPLFGLFMVMVGYLIFRSTFLPRILGVWFAVSGVAWVTFLVPPLAARLGSITLLLGLSEVALMVWLLVKGVNQERWIERSRRVYE